MPQHSIPVGSKVIRVRSVACAERPIVGEIIDQKESVDQWGRPVLRCTIKWPRSVSWVFLDSLCLATPANLRKSQRKISGPKRHHLQEFAIIAEVNADSQPERKEFYLERAKRFRSDLADLDELEEKVGKG